MPTFRHFMVFIAAIVLATLALSLLPACAALTNPNSQLAEQIAVQYATGKYIENEATVDARLARARQVKAVAASLKAVAASDSATVDQLRSLAMSKVAKANLAPADRVLATTLVEVAVQELAKRVDTGALNPDARVAVARLLDWVIAAANAYG